MNKSDRVVVCSRSFSKNSELRKELLSRYRYVKFNDDGLSLDGQALVEFLQGATKAILGLERLERTSLIALPKLKVVGKFGVGLDKLDLKAMRDHELSWLERRCEPPIGGRNGGRVDAVYVA